LLKATIPKEGHTASALVESVSKSNIKLVITVYLHFF
jgi:hypothetical protein